MSHRVEAEYLEKKAHSENSAATGAAVDYENDPIAADLQEIIERWADLPDAVKAGIVAIVRASGAGGVIEGRDHC